MLGAIVGDVIGSAYERNRTKNYDFGMFVPGTCFTDDTVLTVAVADHFLSGRPYPDVLRDFTRRYPDAGYGGRYFRWASADGLPSPVSWGNGGAMRVSSVAYVHETVERVIGEANESAMPTHGHPEGVRGAEAVAASVFLARKGGSKQEIRAFVEERFGYDLNRSLEAIRPGYRFTSASAGSVPEAVIAFLESDSFEDAIRKSVSLGGDADTQACIAGAIAEPFYGGVPENLWKRARTYLPQDLLDVVSLFRERYPVPVPK